MDTRISAIIMRNDGKLAGGKCVAVGFGEKFVPLRRNKIIVLGRPLLYEKMGE